ncbi:MAG TPA: class I SAM-dependent methyltransferase [Cellulomonas sp.]
MTEPILAPPFPTSALLCAAARAAHLLVDGEPHVFTDSVAARLLGPDGEEAIGYHLAYPGHPLLKAGRAEVTSRSRFAEDVLASSGARQYAVVGAGLDTYAYRDPGQGVRVFEVDRPATQELKRAALARAGLTGPVTFVGADLAVTPLGEALAAAGAHPGEPLVVAALGLAMYLTVDELAAMLTTVAAWPGGAQIALDFLRPPDGEAARAYSEAVGSSVAAAGEPWRSRLSLDEAAGLAVAAGFPRAHATTPRDALPAALWERTDGLRPGGTSGFLHASTRPLPG